MVSFDTLRSAGILQGVTPPAHKPLLNRPTAGESRPLPSGWHCLVVGEIVLFARPTSRRVPLVSVADQYRALAVQTPSNLG